MTPLHEAARVNNIDMIEWLLSHEARMEEKTFTEQQTPLHYAAMFESIEVMEILLNKGGMCVNIIILLGMIRKQ